MNKQTQPIVLTMILCIFLFFFTACSGNTDTPTASMPDGTASVAFDVVWKDAKRPAYIQGLDGCTEVYTVEAVVNNLDNDTLKEGGPWPCNLGQALLTGVPATGGSGSVVVLGNNQNGVLIYRGQSTLISLIPDTTISAGTIEAVSFIPELVSPADNSSVTNGGIVLDWATVDGANQYRIEVAAVEGSGDPVSYTASNNSYTITDLLLPYTSYTWKIFAIDANGNEGESDSRTFTTDATGYIAEPISPANNSDVINGSIALTWTSISAASQYRIEVAAVEGSGDPVSYTSSINSYTIPDLLLPNLSYTWKVITIDANNNEFESESHYFTTDATGNMGKPTLLEPVSDPQTMPYKNFTLDWTSVEGAVQYRVELSQAAGIPSLTYTTDTSHEITNALSIGAAYNWQVFAIDDIGYEGASDIGTFGTENKAPTTLINNPPDNTTYPRDQIIEFSGNGIDIEDGATINQSLSWTINNSLIIGNTTSFNEPFNSFYDNDYPFPYYGNNELTLKTTDSQGDNGSTTILVTIVDSLDGSWNHEISNVEKSGKNGGCSDIFDDLSSDYCNINTSNGEGPITLYMDDYPGNTGEPNYCDLEGDMADKVYEVTWNWNDGSGESSIDHTITFELGRRPSDNRTIATGDGTAVYIYNGDPDNCTYTYDILFVQSADGG